MQEVINEVGGESQTTNEAGATASSRGYSRVYDIITERIIELLEQGTVPWRKPWRSTDVLPTNLESGKAYRGINVFLLHCAPYATPYWVTFKQALALGGSVRKGAKGFPVIFWTWNLKEETAGDPESVQRFPILRYYADRRLMPTDDNLALLDVRLTHSMSA
jgi:antirestriction protein ArdC